MLLFNSEKCIKICLKNSNKYVRLAVEDMRKDFKRISRAGFMPEFTDNETEACIVIEENTGTSCEPLSDESFSVKTQNNSIIISADGYLGSMWGIYTFCEKYLGVDPCYLFNDKAVSKKAELEIDDINISDSPKSFGFRGIFINDEDLLTGWKDGGGIRYLDYTWYGLTVDVSAMRMVVETALRLRLNLIIPASFLDIDNPPEKALADCVAERGIYLSQHHLEPLGLSHFTLDNYCGRFNKAGEYSYIKNPGLLKEAWAYYAEKWAEYDNVIWQIGLRGKADRPVWEEDVPTEAELKKYGQIINEAMAVQKEIVKKATNGKAKYFTSTLWMEGSLLVEKKFLDVSDDTIMIFSDTGPNQMYGADYTKVPRRKDISYGIYYHLQYFACGPHLAPQTGINKLYYNMNRAYKNGDDSYCILNVSNIREFVFEFGAYAQMMWNIEEFSKEAYIDRYSADFRKHKNEIKKCITAYYENLPELDVCYLKQHLEKYFNYDYENSPVGIKNFVLKEGMILAHGAMVIENFNRQERGRLCDEFYVAIKKVIPKYEELLNNLERLHNKLTGKMKRHIEVKWCLYVKTLLGIYKWYTNLCEAKAYHELGDAEKMKNSLNLACGELRNYLKIRKCAEYGQFKNWYRGETKLNIKKHLADTMMLLGQCADWE